MRSNRVFFSAAFLLSAGIATAAMSISDVVNYGNRIGTGLPGYGIAQGSLFAITGSGVGPDQAMQAVFPLPAGDGLGGVTVTITAGGANVPAILVYVSANEVDAILPSGIPLGAATVRVNNNGAMATAPLTVVASAFGIFTSYGGGFGPALAFNVNDDGSMTQNGVSQSARPGQTVVLNGTGLGKIASDETQQGATDAPAAALTLWVGSAKAKVVSAARGTCCDGLDPAYPIPPGIAAWDVVTFVVPDGAAGCQVSVAAQIGNAVSNLAPIAVAAAGGVCPEVAGLNLGDLVTLPNPLKTGLITMTRVVSSLTLPTQITNTSDSGTALFSKVTLDQPAQVSDQIYASFLKATAGSCTVTAVRVVTGGPPPTQPPAGPKPVLLDAGPALNYVGPKVTKAMTNRANVYNATTVVTTVNLPGSPPVTAGGPGFIEGGPYSLDNGNGGPDIPAFNIPLVNPLPIVWTNAAQVTAVTRGQDLTLKWTGGDADGFMVISGSATQVLGNVVLAGIWSCMVRTADGQFTVPGFITAKLPQIVMSPAPTGIGNINLAPIIGRIVTVPGVDLTNYFSTWSTGKSVTYP